ncbi:MAG: hypothetical protein V1690_02225 [Candidatus Moraniibacteriota bacterium]
MCELIKNVRWGKVILAGLIFLAISIVLRQIESFLTVDYYKMPEFFGVWSKVMMPKAAPPPINFYLASILFTLISGTILAVIYEKIRNIFPEDKWKKIFNFTCFITILSIIFFTFPVYLLFHVPLALLLIWVVTSIIIYFLAAIVFNKLLH